MQILVLRPSADQFVECAHESEKNYYKEKELLIVSEFQKILPNLKVLTLRLDVCNEPSNWIWYCRAANSAVWMHTKRQTVMSPDTEANSLSRAEASRNTDLHHSDLGRIGLHPQKKTIGATSPPETCFLSPVRDQGLDELCPWQHTDGGTHSSSSRRGGATGGRAGATPPPPLQRPCRTESTMIYAN